MPRYVYRNGHRVARYSRDELARLDAQGRRLLAAGLWLVIVGVAVGLFVHWWSLALLGLLVCGVAGLCAVAIAHYESQV